MQKKRGVEGANIIGAFLEGPCFTEVYKGAQNSKYFIDPTIEMLEGVDCCIRRDN